MWLLPLGCAGLLGSSDRPPGFSCPLGATHEVDPPGAGADRVLPDTELHGCTNRAGQRVGDHMERWPDGAVAVEGRWSRGRRDGAWTRWHRDGAFLDQSSWSDGVEEGARRIVSRDGRITEITLAGGVATGWVVLPLGAPMPEWEDGRRIDGTRYRSHAADPETDADR